MKKNHLAIIAVLAVLVAAGGGWWVYFGGANSGPGFADTGDAELVALGKTVYVAQCAACHGANLEGQANWRERRPDGRLPAPPHDATGHTWHHPDPQLFETTKRGVAALLGPDYKTDIGGFGDVLGDREIWAVLAYIKSRWPEPIRRRNDKLNAQAKAARR